MALCMYVLFYMCERGCGCMPVAVDMSVFFVFFPISADQTIQMKITVQTWSFSYLRETSSHFLL